MLSMTVAQLLNRLPEDEGKVVYYVDLLDKSVAETARLLKKDVCSVEALRRDGKRRLVWLAATAALR